MPTLVALPNNQSNCSTQEILLCGPGSIANGFIDEYPTKFLVDTGASMTTVKLGG